MATGRKTGGRTAGTPNKTTKALKDAILEAAAAAGGGDLIAYLTEQARANPVAFMTLLGKVLPQQVTGDDGGPVVHRIELVAATVESIAAAERSTGPTLKAVA